MILARQIRIRFYYNTMDCSSLFSRLSNAVYIVLINSYEFGLHNNAIILQ